MRKTSFTLTSVQRPVSKVKGEGEKGQGVVIEMKLILQYLIHPFRLCPFALRLLKPDP
jgi:hypothetical protein